MTPQNLVLGASVTPGASDVITTQLVQAELVIPTAQLF